MMTAFRRRARVMSLGALLLDASRSSESFGGGLLERPRLHPLVS